MKVIHVMDSYGKLWCGRKITKSMLIEKGIKTHVPLECVCLRCAWSIGQPNYYDDDIQREGIDRRENRRRLTFTKNGIRVYS